MPQSNVIAQVNAKSQGTTQNHQADCTSVLSQGKLRKRKKRNETFCSGSFNLSSVYWTAALCLRKNVALLSGWDYLYCPRCHMDLKLRRSISVRDLSAIRPSTVGSMFSLTGFIGVPKPLPWRQKLCPSISSVWQVSMLHVLAVAKTKSGHMFVFCFKINILWKVVWKAQFNFLRFQILSTTT